MYKCVPHESYAHSLCDSRGLNILTSPCRWIGSTEKLQGSRCVASLDCLKGHERLESLASRMEPLPLLWLMLPCSVTNLKSGHIWCFPWLGMIDILPSGLSRPNPQPLDHFWLWINALGGWNPDRWNMFIVAFVATPPGEHAMTLHKTCTRMLYSLAAFDVLMVAYPFIVW